MTPREFANYTNLPTWKVCLYYPLFLLMMLLFIIIGYGIGAWDKVQRAKMSSDF